MAVRREDSRRRRRRRAVHGRVHRYRVKIKKRGKIIYVIKKTAARIDVGRRDGGAIVARQILVIDDE